ncbi:TPM domain-containing protein [Sphingomonas sp. R86520]|uniref:TPM domain-containing protein n=1 Tax=Sphingomonas sp. R86520 TaxID=3093859 RepID=UPI0036D26842
MRLSDADHDRVTAAVTRAETATTGEIVTIVARQSDSYHDVSLHWAVLAMLLALALLAYHPVAAEHIYALIDPWQAAPQGALYMVALVLVTLVFLAVRLALASTPARLALTPGATKARRVRRRALLLFRAGAEKRTRGATGVLLYLSLAEHRAEIIADDAIHSRVPNETWGAAMAAVLAGVRDDRPADGMADAVAQIGAVLAEHFPRTGAPVNELPDRLIEL